MICINVVNLSANSRIFAAWAANWAMAAKQRCDKHARLMQHFLETLPTPFIWAVQ
jgi:hypothetical protein